MSWQKQMREFVEHRKISGFARETVLENRRVLRRFIEMFEKRGWNRPGDLTPQRLLKVRRMLRKKPIQASTRHCYLKTLKGFLAFLFERGEILYDLHRRLHLPRAARLPREILNVKEAAAILNAPDTRTPLGLRDRAILEMFYSTGIRRNELRALRVEDVDLSKGLVHVRKGKGGKDRTVPIGKEALRHLKKYARQARVCFAFGEHANTFFLSRAHQPLSEKGIGHIVAAARRKSGITKSVTPHTFRHSFAVGLMRGKAKLPQIQKLLGHADITTTQIYTRVSAEELKEVHRRAHPRERRKADER